MLGTDFERLFTFENIINLLETNLGRQLTQYEVVYVRRKLNSSSRPKIVYHGDSFPLGLQYRD
jgi:hypothetical protein